MEIIEPPDETQTILQFRLIPSSSACNVSSVFTGIRRSDQQGMLIYKMRKEIILAYNEWQLHFFGDKLFHQVGPDP
jgi:hypothetical protein